ncbi:hypothetical protein [Neopusillimonas aromaticivorans]|uniref:hypothetical protein n=1 Tax=Neopusillimonas aromaticivorans TaxID=2979868 RepID=UPI00259A4BA2|nr:hypothetical protein [Neopusillimonas aromaticivorans]WJJ93951.1 hypothetical protein N7E01_01820 [Neopusillimonas aromaticivorans]
MSIPTLEQKLAWLKPAPASERELELAAQLSAADFEIGFQRTNDILDEGMDVFVRSCRCAMGVAGDSLVAIMTAEGDIVNGSCGTYLHAVIPRWSSNTSCIRTRTTRVSKTAIYGLPTMPFTAAYTTLTKWFACPYFMKVN